MVPDVSTKDTSGYTALTRAWWRGRYDVVELSQTQNDFGQRPKVTIPAIQNRLHLDELGRPVLTVKQPDVL